MSEMPAAIASRVQTAVRDAVAAYRTKARTDVVARLHARGEVAIIAAIYARKSTDQNVSDEEKSVPPETS